MGLFFPDSALRHPKIEIIHYNLHIIKSIKKGSQNSEAKKREPVLGSLFTGYNISLFVL